MRLLTPNAERERARLEAEQIRIEQERLRAEARNELALQQVQHEAEVARRNAILAEERKAHVAAQAAAQREMTRAHRRELRERWAERARTAGRLAVMSVTNLGVNGVAVAGQAISFTERGWPLWAAALAAGIIESVAVYVSWHAHVALREGDAAWRLRMTSYLIGAAAGYLSYTHVPMYPELFAACSLASPWLWSMHSRHLHRQDLREQGLIDPRAPKFSALRWLLHRRETFAAFRWAVGEGVQSPQVAVEVVRTRRTVETARQALAEARDRVIVLQRAQLELALTHMAAVYEEVYGMDPNAAAAKATLARFINRVGAGLIPMYRPEIGRPVEEKSDETADDKRTDGTDEPRTDGGRKADGPRPRMRWRDLLRPGRTADEDPSAGRTNKADEKQTDGGQTADDAPAKKRTNEQTDGGQTADEKPPRKRTDDAGGRRTNGGRTNRTGGRTAGPDDLGALLPLGRTILAEHEQTGGRLTRDALRRAVNATGQTLSNERASALLHLLRTDGPSAADGADGNGSSARTNEAADGGPSGADEADEDSSSADDKGEN
ncbi:hypothetical protein [Microbispora bryophytorum]|uniref:hypothetical protein n=1 Tax=Microbispora bryophytorum TaxID=1460882 RepID=UPI0033ED9DC4